jgi:hypothetical protein
MLNVKTNNESAMGLELYNEIQRLICEWRGNDAIEQSAALPELVGRIARLKDQAALRIVEAAAHDSAEAA